MCHICEHFIGICSHVNHTGPYIEFIRVLLVFSVSNNLVLMSLVLVHFGGYLSVVEVDIDPRSEPWRIGRLPGWCKDQIFGML